MFILVKYYIHPQHCPAQTKCWHNFLKTTKFTLLNEHNNIDDHYSTLFIRYINN